MNGVCVCDAPASWSSPALTSAIFCAACVHSKCCNYESKHILVVTISIMHIQAHTQVSVYMYVCAFLHMSVLTSPWRVLTRTNFTACMWTRSLCVYMHACIHTYILEHISCRHTHMNNSLRACLCACTFMCLHRMTHRQTCIRRRKYAWFKFVCVFHVCRYAILFIHYSDKCTFSMHYIHTYMYA
jgi:hypothetical protein